MTILPLPIKAKKGLRKEEKRPADDRNDRNDRNAVQSSSSSHQSHRAPSVLSHPSHLSHPHLSHSSHSSHSSHPSHPSSSPSPGPPRKVARTSKPLSSLSIPLSSSSSSSVSPTAQPITISPRGSRDEKKSGEEEKEGPNSDDEYDRGFRDEKLEKDFERSLKEERGLEIKKMVGDGACLFRAVSHQVYGDEEMHGEVRRLSLDYMEKNREHFEQFITEDFAAYIARKRRPTVHGNHVELQATSEIYNRPIEIYEYNINPINVFHPKSTGSSSSSGGTGGSNEKKEEKEEMNAPIRLSYHGSTHYNAVIDPLVPTVGVGLGLPSFEPGLADRQLIADALSKSVNEMDEIEQAMLKDKMSMTDWERTEEDIKDQVLRESYMEYARGVEGGSSGSGSGGRIEKGEKGGRPSPSPSPSSSRHFHSASTQPCSSRHHEYTDRPGPSSLSAPSNSSAPPTRSNLYEELLMAEALEWSEDNTYDSSLAEALIMSQQTFLTECTRRPDDEGSGED